MADYDGSKGVKTVRDDDLVTRLADGKSGDTATHILSVVQEGDAIVADTNDWGLLLIGKDSSGNAAILPLGSGGGLVIEATDLDIRDLSASQDNVAISDGTDTLAVNADGSINAVVTATDLDIRQLVHTGGTPDSVQIGDGTEILLVNADGSINAVVTATDLDIRDLSASQDNVAISDGTDTLAVNADGSINAVVTATDLDIRALSHTTDSIALGDGTDLLDIESDGQAAVTITDAQGATGAAVPSEAVQVAGSDGTNLQPIATDSNGNVKTIEQEAGSEVLDFQTTATVGANAVTNHDYTVTSGQEFQGLQVLVGARGEVKVEVGLWDGVSTFTPKYTYFQDPSENRPIPITQLRQTGDGTVGIRVRITNLDGQSSDVYSTLEGRSV
jgi:hypothetical protein